jgi:hypothetical protein
MLIYPKPNKVNKLSKVEKWNNARLNLKRIYKSRNITSCEVMLDECWKTNALSFAHRYKRNDKRCSHTFEGTILTCVPCHQKLEVNQNLTNYYFKKLR